jgi:hypothetical protein
MFVAMLFLPWSIRCFAPSMSRRAQTATTIMNFSVRELLRLATNPMQIKRNSAGHVQRNEQFQRNERCN